MQDRNFDDIAARFEEKIYNGSKPKGVLRHKIIWRDLHECIPNLAESPRLITDVGAGLGQFVIELAEMGHQVIYNDVSTVMRNKAKDTATKRLDESALKRIAWFNQPYQTLPSQPSDIVLCHAVIEWLADPEKLLINLAQQVNNKGILSLCFYNTDGYRLRNLIAGNFNLLDRDKTKPDPRSLTPMNPSETSDILLWMKDAGFSVLKQSGIRVFSDYTLVKRGGLNNDDAVIEKEIEFSDKAPFNSIGRYTHILAINTE